jgi:hypothetical protein
LEERVSERVGRSWRGRSRTAAATLAAPPGAAGRAALYTSGMRAGAAGYAGSRRGLSQRVRSKTRPACIPTSASYMYSIELVCNLSTDVGYG